MQAAQAEQWRQDRQDLEVKAATWCQEQIDSVRRESEEAAAAVHTKCNAWSAVISMAPMYPSGKIWGFLVQDMLPYVSFCIASLGLLLVHQMSTEYLLGVRHRHVLLVLTHSTTWWHTAVWSCFHFFCMTPLLLSW